LEKCSKAHRCGFHYLFRRGGTILIAENEDPNPHPDVEVVDPLPLPLADMADPLQELTSFEEWLNGDVLDEESCFNSEERLEGINWVGRMAEMWRVEAVYSSRRVCSSFGGCGIAMHDVLVRYIGVTVPFSSFEYEVLCHLKIAPSNMF